MHVVIITKNLPPAICGIGDYSVLLGETIRSHGHKVTLAAANGLPNEHCLIAKDFWLRKETDGFIKKLLSINPDHIILGYTPLTFVSGGGYQNFDIGSFWSNCFHRWKTSLILHETYFRAWWHPASIIKSVFEKHLLETMVRNSHHVFTASQPLFDEIKQWNHHAKVALLPIASHLPFTPNDPGKVRCQNGIESNEIILTLFGGGVGLQKLKHYVSFVDSILAKEKQPARWLFLGAIDKQLFRLKLPILSPGFLPPKDLSSWLQLTDIFLMPHISGLSAKRSTLMAAMQHSLPVVGTQGPMTDLIWRAMPGILLSPMPGKRQFAANILKLIRSPRLRKEMGLHNFNYYNKYLTWEHITEKLLRFITDNENSLL